MRFLIALSLDWKTVQMLASLPLLTWLRSLHEVSQNGRKSGGTSGKPHARGPREPTGPTTAAVALDCEMVGLANDESCAEPVIRVFLRLRSV